MTADNSREIVQDYHRRSKHHLKRYADGPGTLDWDSQPNPFRSFEGAAQYRLPLTADRLTSTYKQIHTPDATATKPVTTENLGAFFELSFALSAWKQYGSARWSLRCNPSSGNLHPTEAYAILRDNMEDISAGVYHYRSDQHALEQRCRFPANDRQPSVTEGFLLGLSTIAWREAWKYGERAFRYCQLDTGHAIACASYAAAVLGWHARLLARPGDTQISQLLGLDRKQDFTHAERETPEVLLEIVPANIQTAAEPDLNLLQTASQQGEWYGQANLLDPKPMYNWPVIHTITLATEKPVTDLLEWNNTLAQTAHPAVEQDINLAKIIRKRRSAQAYDGQSSMSLQDFSRLLASLLPGSGTPVWESWPYPPHIHPVFFIHRVEGLARGLYIQVRNPSMINSLREQLNPEFDWKAPEAATDLCSFEQLGFYHLVSANAQNAARTIACHQDIASNGAFSVAMLAEFNTQIEGAAWRYRQLYQEAGMVGQVLYIEAEVSQLSGTGIGCFFDDVVHEILGISDEGLQCLYQFTIGGALRDYRLVELPPY